MSAPAQPPSPAPRPPGWRAWLLTAGSVLALVALALVLMPVWRRHSVVAHIPESLPARPQNRTVPALLAARLAPAEQQAKNPATALAGVTELGRLYHASNFHHEAGVCWQLLHAAQPREPRWSYYLADLRRSANDYPAMAELLARVTQLAPDYAPAWLRLADLQLKTGKLADAEASYQRRLALVPRDPYASLGLTRVALQQNRRDEARTRVEQLLKDAPEFSPGHNLYAEMLSAQGDTAGAAKHRWFGRETGRFREADDPWLDELAPWCFDYDQLCIRGTVDFQTKRGDRGLSFFERAIALQPDSLTGYELLGRLHLELNDPAGARAAFERGLQHAPGARPSVMFYVNLGRAYRELKQPAEAVRVIREGLARAGQEMELYDALGVALGDLGDREGAVEALRTAVKLSPSDTSANYNLAMALISVRKLDEAVEALHRSLTLRPTFPASLALLAQIEIDSGRWQSSLQYLQPLYDSHPEMPQAREMMAHWRLRSGAEAEKQRDLPGAETHFRAGLAIEPNHAELQARLGAVLLIQGRFADAIAPLEAFHRLQPGNAQSALFLGQAYAAVGRRDEARRVLTEGAEAAERAGNATTARYCREILRQLP